MNRLPRTIVVMGVSGCGKSLIGRMLAVKLNAVFEDADDFHPDSNIAKMSAGIPLTDEDRWPWYRILRERIVTQRASGRVYVLACSALKQAYRDLLRGNDSQDDLKFVHLKGTRELIGGRLVLRQAHFMPPELLDSQFAVMEEPQGSITMDVSLAPDEIARQIFDHFR
jgi:gluconokinase